MQFAKHRGSVVAAVAIYFAFGSVIMSGAKAQQAIVDPALAAKGVWTAKKTYAKDDIVTARGSAWISLRAGNKKHVPGQTNPSSAIWWGLFARGFNPSGAWLASKVYQPDDLVTSGGETYRAILTNRNTPVSNASYWELFAAKGAAGPNTGVSAGSQSVPAISFQSDPNTGIFSPSADKIAMVEGGKLFLHNLGTDNAAFGLSALGINTTGFENTAIGSAALQANTTGSDNTAVGSAALFSNTTGGYNTAVGPYALSSNTTGTDHVALGYAALAANTTGSYNIAVGSSALQANTTGSDNTAVGTFALDDNTTGVENAALGKNALQANTTGSDNTALGVASLYSNTTGGSNTAVGPYALFSNTTGGYNIAVGYNALASNTNGWRNTAVGQSALHANTTADDNTAVGLNALPFNTTGAANVGVGNYTLFDNSIGNENAAFGARALQNNTTGEGNAGLGFQALYANTTGSNNIGLGYKAGYYATAPARSIFIGNEGLPNDTTTIKIGTQGTQTSTFIAGIHNVTSTGGIAVYVNSNGQLGTATSSRRYKDDIQPIEDVGLLLAKLRPVTFRYKQADVDGSKPKQYGLVAEEVEEISSDLAAYNKDGSVETVKYHFLPPLLLAGWQAQQKTIAAQANKIDAQAKEIAALKQRVAATDALEARLRRLEALLPQTKAAALQ